MLSLPLYTPTSKLLSLDFARFRYSPILPTPLLPKSFRYISLDFDAEPSSPQPHPRNCFARFRLISILTHPPNTPTPEILSLDFARFRYSSFLSIPPLPKSFR